MASIAIIGDVHASYRRLDASLELLRGSPCDLALLAGDVGLDVPWDPSARERGRGAHDASVNRVLTAVHETLGCPVAFVPGNHDLRDPRPVPGATNIDGSVGRIEGLSIAGFGGAGPAQFGFPYEWTEAEADAVLEKLEPPTDIFLSHTPPADTVLDRTLHGKHVGSTAVRRSLERLAPRLFICGHIHEAWGFAQIAGTPCINAGALGPPAERDIAWHVHWDDGPAYIEARHRPPSGQPTTHSWPLRT